MENSLTYLNAGNGGPSASMAGKIFQITSLSNVVLPTGLVANPAAITFTIDPASGAILGSFTLINDPDPTDLVAPIATVPRKVPFGGLIVPRLGIGVGNFQLPELPSLGPPKTTVTTSPRWSGQVLIQSNP